MDFTHDDGSKGRSKKIFFCRIDLIQFKMSLLFNMIIMKSLIYFLLFLFKISSDNYLSIFYSFIVDLENQQTLFVTIKYLSLIDQIHVYWFNTTVSNGISMEQVLKVNFYIETHFITYELFFRFYEYSLRLVKLNVNPICIKDLVYYFQIKQFIYKIMKKKTCVFFT